MDLNKDGRLDILSGSYSRRGKDSMAGVFLVLRGGEDGKFAKPEVLKGTDGKPLIIPANRKEATKKICTRPMAVDWDGDGDLDLVVGNFKGSFYLFRGEGGEKFNPKPEEMTGDGAPLQIRGAHSDPFPVDWDGDGDLDLLSGSAEGGVQWAENTAGAAKEPTLTKFVALIKPTESGNAGMVKGGAWPTMPSGSTRVWADDVNGDGKLDLLVGDRTSVLRPIEGEDSGETKKKLAAWQKTNDELLKEVLNAIRKTGGKLDRELSMRYNAHHQKRHALVTDKRIGFVWLYVRK